MHPGYRIACWISLAVAAVWIAAVTVALFPLVPDFPIWDQWHLVPQWQAWFAGEPVLPHLLAPYNGHLNLLPRWVFFGLGIATHWDVRAEVVAGYLVAALTTLLLVHLLAAGDRRRLLLAAPVAFAVFHLAQFEVFLSGYHLGQHLCQAALAGMLVLLFRDELRFPTLLGAVACAAAATFSWGSGVLAWPLGGLILVVRRRRIDLPVVLWGGVAAAVLGLVAHTGTPPTVIWRVVPRFAVSLLGRELSPLPFPRSAATLSAGYIGLTLFVLLVVLALVRQRASPPFWRAVAVALSGIAAAVIIALGRAGAGLGPALSVVSHYATATAPFGIGLVALVTDALLDWQDRGAALPRRARALPALVLGLALTAVAGQSVWVAVHVVPEISQWMRAGQEAFGRFLLGQLTDEEVARYLHPSPPLVREGVALLREHGWGPFAPCSTRGYARGAVERVTGRAVEGWAVDGGGRVPLPEIRLERAGLPLATAATGQPRPDLAWRARRATWVLAGWRAELPPGAPAGKVEVVAVSCNGSRAVLGVVDLGGRGG